MHFMGNQYVEVEPGADTGFVETYAVAYHMEAAESGREDLVMGVRYRTTSRATAGQMVGVAHRAAGRDARLGPRPVAASAVGDRVQEPRMTRPAAVVTGANAGIGRAIAEALAVLGHPLILACRSIERAAPVVAAIRESTGNNEVVAVRLDLSDLQDVVRCANEIVGAFAGRRARQQRRRDVLRASHVTAGSGVDVQRQLPRALLAEPPAVGVTV